METQRTRQNIPWASKNDELREIVSLSHQGYTDKEIASQIQEMVFDPEKNYREVTPNTICVLRRNIQEGKYGPVFGTLATETPRIEEALENFEQQIYENTSFGELVLERQSIIYNILKGQAEQIDMYEKRNEENQFIQEYGQLPLAKALRVLSAADFKKLQKLAQGEREGIALSSLDVVIASNNESQTILLPLTARRVNKQPQRTIGSHLYDVVVYAMEAEQNCEKRKPFQGKFRDLRTVNYRGSVDVSALENTIGKEINAAYPDITRVSITQDSRTLYK